MPVTPSGSFSLAMVRLQEAIARCASFQTWTGSADAEEAKARVYLFHLPAASTPDKGYSAADLAAFRPGCALTYMPPMALRTSQPNFRRIRTATDSFTQQATLYVHIEDVVRAGEGQPYAGLNESEVLIQFTNALGALGDDLVQDEPLLIQEVSMVLEPYRVDLANRATQGDCLTAMLRVETGLNRR